MGVWALHRNWILALRGVVRETNGERATVFVKRRLGKMFGCAVWPAAFRGCGKILFWRFGVYFVFCVGFRFVLLFRILFWARFWTLFGFCFWVLSQPHRKKSKKLHKAGKKVHTAGSYERN